MNRTKKKYSKPDMLVALLKEKNDLEILLNHNWYRIPIKSAPVDLYKIKFLSFYQPSIFKSEKYKIKYYGIIKKIQVIKRKELFPDEIKNSKSELEYYKIIIDRIQELDEPIISKKGRRMVFIKTTLEKFINAHEINDLFHESPLEDKLWQEFKNFKISAERQFYIGSYKRNFFLDFALFCRERNLNVECDGDLYHINKAKAILDNERDNFLNKSGWNILRYSTTQLENISTCINEISDTINTNGGLYISPQNYQFYTNEKKHNDNQLELL